MSSLVYDTGEAGFRAVLKDYQEIALRVLWESPIGFGSREVNLKVNERLGGDTISRASLINFIEDMRERGVLKGEDRTGKGGHHWIYSPAMDEAQFKRYVASTILEFLQRDFPEETRAALTRIPV